MASINDIQKRREMLRQMARLLRPHERQVVRLRLRGLSDAQIGLKLGISRAAVGMRMVRVRRRIERDLPEAVRLLVGGSRAHR
jgi:DNA-directed RNA polymerase specialized sigma24 family protein